MHQGGGTHSSRDCAEVAQALAYDELGDLSLQAHEFHRLSAAAVETHGRHIQSAG